MLLEVIKKKGRINCHEKYSLKFVSGFLGAVRDKQKKSKVSTIGGLSSPKAVNYKVLHNRTVNIVATANVAMKSQELSI